MCVCEREREKERLWVGERQGWHVAVREISCLFTRPRNNSFSRAYNYFQKQGRGTCTGPMYFSSLESEKPLSRESFQILPHIRGSHARVLEGVAGFETASGSDSQKSTPLPCRENRLLANPSKTLAWSVQQRDHIFFKSSRRGVRSHL